MLKLQENSNMKNPFTILTIVRKINEIIDKMEWNIVVEPIANKQIEENRKKMEELEERMNALVESNNIKLSEFADRLESFWNRIENKIIKWQWDINKLESKVEEQEEVKDVEEKNILIQLNDDKGNKKNDIQLFEDICKLKWDTPFTPEWLENISLLKPVQVKLLLSRLSGRKMVEKVSGKWKESKYKCII